MWGTIRMHKLEERHMKYKIIKYVTRSGTENIPACPINTAPTDEPNLWCHWCLKLPLLAKPKAKTYAFYEQIVMGNWSSITLNCTGKFRTTRALFRGSRGNVRFVTAFSSPVMNLQRTSNSYVWFENTVHEIENVISHRRNGRCFFMVRRQNYLPEKTTAILKKAKNPEFWGQTSTAYHPQSWPQSSQLQL